MGIFDAAIMKAKVGWEGFVGLHWSRFTTLIRQRGKEVRNICQASLVARVQRVLDLNNI